MEIITRDFIRGAIIGLIGVLTFCFYLNPHSLTSVWNFISENTISLFISAFMGGFSAGYFGYYFNSKSRVEELRHTKYFEHRNTIVQIEHELIGIRVNLSRDIESIKSALEVKNDRYRFILRFFSLEISSGLSLRLLDLDLINKYSELYIIFQSINSDLEYLGSMVKEIQSKIDIDNPQPTPALMGLMNNYITMINHVYNQLLSSDKMSLELVAICKIALIERLDVKLKEYIKKGGEIKYSITKSDIDKKIKEISKEENRPGTEKNPKPKFVALYFDLVRVIVSNPVI